jgi:hypothetical protein
LIKPSVDQGLDKGSVVKRVWQMGALVAGAAAMLPLATAADAQFIKQNTQSARRAPPLPPPAVATRPVGRQTVPLPEIVADLQAQPPYRNMNYIGVERFDPRTGLYALRFLNGRQVVVVHVDGRTGRVVNRGF